MGVFRHIKEFCASVNAVLLEDLKQDSFLESN